MKEVKNQRPRNSALHAEHRKRMKAKFLQFGLEPFSEHEIMEILLYYALPQVDTNEIAHQLINKGGSFVGAFNIPYEEMKTITGIKDQAATFLKLIPEIVRYYSAQETQLSSDDKMTYEQIAALCVKSFIGMQTEQLYGFYFDSKMHFLGKSIIGKGGKTGVTSDFKTIYDEVLKYGAANVVLAHNHPSVVVVPSSDDVASTNSLIKFLRHLDVDLIEHFIVAGDSYIGIVKFIEESQLRYDRLIEENSK